MSVRLATLVASFLVQFGLGLPGDASAQAAAPLSLDAAFARVVDVHPDLQALGYSREALAAEIDQAGLAPALLIGVELENALGSGATAGVDAAELTLTLSSVLERGGKRDARLLLARSRYDAYNSTEQARRLDLMAEVARRYFDVVFAQTMQAIAAADVTQRGSTIKAAARRVQAGAAPESVQLAAEAALARAELMQSRASRNSASARRRLALLWNAHEPDFSTAVGDPLDLPAVADFQALADLLERTPELKRFAGETRIREARLRLTKSQATADIDWQVGIRRLQVDDDWALVGSVSLPLGHAGRAEPALRGAAAELAALEYERESKEFSLYATLAEAYGRLDAAALEVAQTRDDLLPKLLRAERSAGQAYRAGALSYLEWAQLQSEITATRRQQLEAAREAHTALIEIQRLTGESLLAEASDRSKD